ncbi:hypothetical protein GCM10022280_27680 [Sphingomonas swuensis]|uniref:PD-(D/E)XK endonuclease-like domain-containing protein n=1 Tax=Sphingomonas swuensis TaxID=977800 RepID=A0ABP7TEP9_9SPHN
MSAESTLTFIGGAPKWPRLSKSKIATFEHCARRLWLSVYRRDLAKIDPPTELLFAIGHRFGELVREQVPNGILLDTDPRRVDDAIAETKAILSGPWNRPIFEAALQHEDVIVRPDVLQPDGWGGWRLIEAKSSTAVRNHHVRDAATQVWVARESGLCISSVIIRHARRRLTSPFARALTAPTVDVDVTSEIRNIIRSRSRVAAAAREVIRGPEPQRAVGAHCTYPFRCEFRDHCSQQA